MKNEITMEDLRNVFLNATAEQTKLIDLIFAEVKALKAQDEEFVKQYMMGDNSNGEEK